MLQSNPPRRYSDLQDFMEALAALVLVILIVPLHVEQVQIRPAIVVAVDNAGIARP